MSIAKTRDESPTVERPTGKGWLAGGGMLGAFLASACCVVPFALVSLGISGAWIGNLTALSPYKPIFATVALGFIAAGFWQVYRRKPANCAPGTYCARPSAARITRTVLWAGLVLTLASLTITWWVPLLY